ncbi:MAG: FkbM family methyltransferase [Spirochaetaceae bacterium]|nr:FkbM family methyltransferase [Spirochaetaceae bacterium]
MTLKTLLKKGIKFFMPYGILWLYPKIKKIIKRYYRTKKYSAFRCPYQWLGTEYGGFDVCLDLLDSKKERNIIVYSAGVGCDISFDEELMRRYKNIEIYAFDPTPLSINWIKKQRLPSEYRFIPLGIGSQKGKETMYLPKSYGVSFTVYDWDISNQATIEVEMETINGFMKTNGHTFVDILKLDIEGSEFSVLKTMDFTEVSFGQILIEFHDRFIKNGKDALTAIIARLQENGYYCFAVSSFNEYGFVNKALYEKVFQ